MITFTIVGYPQLIGSCSDNTNASLFATAVRNAGVKATIYHETRCSECGIERRHSFDLISAPGELEYCQAVHVMSWLSASMLPFTAHKPV